MKKMNVDSFLTISNRLIMSRNSLTPLEQTIFYAICQHKQVDCNSKIKDNGEHLITNEHSMNKSYLKMFVNERWVTPKSLSESLNNILNNHIFEDINGNKVKILNRAFLANKDTIYVEFNNNFYDHFIRLNGEYTQLPLMLFEGSKSILTNKILELMMMYKSTGKIMINYENMKFLLRKDDSDIYHVTERIKFAMKDYDKFSFSLNKNGVYIIKFSKSRIGYSRR